MADFYTDIHSIKHLVHHSASEEDALKRFHNMQGFSISRNQAYTALNDAMSERFLAKPTSTLASIVQSLAAKYCSPSK